MNKRKTVFPGVSKDDSIADSLFIGRHGTGPVLPKKPRTLDSRWVHTARPIDASEASSQIKNSDPWDRYRPIIIEDQAGTATLAHRNNPSFAIVAVKIRPNPVENTGRLLKCQNNNIVDLLEFFIFKEKVYMIYETIRVSLSEIQSTPCNDFASYEIATVCKDVINGLQFIQSTLGISHGSVITPNIVFASAGYAMLGDSMVANSQNMKQDRMSLGAVVVGLANPVATSEERRNLKLLVEVDHSEGDRSHVDEFLRAFENSSLMILSKHTFLELSPGPGCLKPRIEKAARWIDRAWKSCD